MTSVDDLLLLPADEIRYADLDEATLLALALQHDEPFIATSALGELSRRNVPAAGAAALALLNGDWADRHLRAFAITTLHDADPDRAVEVMASMVDDTDDPKLLGAMVECVLADLERFAADDRKAFTRRLAERVAAVPPDDFTDLDERASFLERFGTPQEP